MNDLEKMRTLLTDSELSELVKAVTTVKNQGDGYGEIRIAIEKRRIKLISVIRNLKPSDEAAV
jgi:hypothetical protein